VAAVHQTTPTPGMCCSSDLPPKTSRTATRSASEQTAARIQGILPDPQDPPRSWLRRAKLGAWGKPAAQRVLQEKLDPLNTLKKALSQRSARASRIAPSGTAWSTAWPAEVTTRWPASIKSGWRDYTQRRSPRLSPEGDKEQAPYRLAGVILAAVGPSVGPSAWWTRFGPDSPGRSSLNKLH